MRNREVPGEVSRDLHFLRSAAKQRQWVSTSSVAEQALESFERAVRDLAAVCEPLRSQHKIEPLGGLPRFSTDRLRDGLAGVRDYFAKRAAS